MDTVQPLFDLQIRFKQAFKSLSPLIGNEVVNFAKDNFTKQGFQGDVFEAWPARKNNKDAGRPILIKRRNLERSIHVIRHNEEEVVVGSSAEVPYAKAHNEGSNAVITQNVKSFSRKVKGIKGISTVKAFSRTIHQNLPKRQFLGKSQYLSARMKRTAVAHIMKTIKF